MLSNIEINVNNWTFLYCCGNIKIHQEHDSGNRLTFHFTAKTSFAKGSLDKATLMYAIFRSSYSSKWPFKQQNKAEVNLIDNLQRNLL
jgi:hypothetical protein